MELENRRSAILENRSAGIIRFNVSEEDLQRIKYYNIFQRYDDGLSDKAITNLTADYKKHWIDTRYFTFLKQTIMDLVLMGLDVKSETDLSELLQNICFYKTMQIAESYLTKCGDVGVKVCQDENSNVSLEIIDPTFIFKPDDDYDEHIIIMWSTVNSIDINGSENVKVQDYIKVRDRVWVREFEVNSFNNNNHNSFLYEDNQLEYDLTNLSEIPVVVFSNFKQEDGWGRSDFDDSLNLIDQFYKNQTDIKIVEPFFALPLLAVSGSRTVNTNSDQGNTFTTKPGAIMNLGENGNLDLIDNSKSLDALCKRQDRLKSEIANQLYLNKNAIGEINDKSDLREVEILLQNAPTVRMVEAKRTERKKDYQKLFTIIFEVLGQQAPEIEIMFESIEQETKTTIQNRLKVAKESEGITQQVYEEETMKLLGLNYNN